jgi:Rrf2 family protein
MVITRATEYSILAVLHLAERYPARVVSKQQISEAEGISPAFLTKILQPLIRGRIVRSKRGTTGGFALSRDPEKFTLIDVMRAVDEPLTLNVCLIEGHDCERGDGCPVHGLWVEARETFERIFSRHSIAHLARERKVRESRRRG